MDCQQVVKTLGWLGETWGFWIQTGAFFLSAVAGIAALFYNGAQLKLIREQADANDKQSRRRATVDLVLHEKGDPMLRQAREQFAELHESGQNFTALACARLTEHKYENSQILMVLNSYEFIAGGIREGAFDEGIYKRMQRSLLIRDWNALAPYVAELRRQMKRDKLFVEMEWLATKWEKDGS